LANNTDKVSPLEWHNVDEGIIQSIEKTTKESYDKSTSVGVETLEFRDYGGKLIKSSKCSPDGFAQAAMFIAFYGMTNALPVPYESVLAKAFKHGRVTVARNMSQSIADNLSSFNQLPQSEQEACFRAMVAEIGRICREAASGNEMDRPILAYRTLANMANAQSKAEGGKDVVVSIPFLQDESWAKLGALDLCTSHCGKPPIRFFGYEPASANGYSVGYYVDNEFMQFSINHFDKKAAKDFKHALDKTLKMLPSIFNDSTTK
jgi:hypothetical protein